MRYTPDYAKNIGMIAGGTGITPMLVRRQGQPYILILGNTLTHAFSLSLCPPTRSN